MTPHLLTTLNLLSVDGRRPTANSLFFAIDRKYYEQTHYDYRCQRTGLRPRENGMDIILANSTEASQSNVHRDTVYSIPNEVRMFGTDEVGLRNSIRTDYLVYLNPISMHL